MILLLTMIFKKSIFMVLMRMLLTVCLEQVDMVIIMVMDYHFGYASNQHNYKYVSIWIDNELLFDKATLSGNNVHWSSVPFENNTQRDKWLSKYDNKYHKLHIKYWR